MSYHHFSHLSDIFAAWFATGIWALMTLAGFIGWIKALRRARLIEDLATSTVRSVAQGYVEIVGTQHSMPGHAVTAPLTGQPCTWWHYKIEEKRRSYADGGRRKNWVVIEEATSPDLILFKDATGQLTVNPKGAEVEPSVTQSWCSPELSSSRPMAVSKLRDGRYRYTEKRMSIGGRIYVAGELRAPSGYRQADAYAQALSDRLNRWKQDQGALIERFDTDRDGRIDAAEWDVARAAAGAEVSSRLQAPAMQQQAEVLCKPGDGQPFLVSAKPQPELAGKYRSDANQGLVLFAIGVGFTIWSIHLVRLVM